MNEREEAELREAVHEILWDAGMGRLTIRRVADAILRIIVARDAKREGLEPPGCPLPGACACPGGEAELAKRLGEVRAREKALLEDNARLRAALEPFAELLGEDDDDFSDQEIVVVKFGRTTDSTLRLGDIRRAALGLSGAGGEVGS